MITFDKFYRAHLVNEATRRDFLKQITGAVAAAVGAPVNAASPHAPHFVYDLTPTVSVKSLAYFLRKYKQVGFDDSKSKAAKLHPKFNTANLNSSTIKQLIAHGNQWIDNLTDARKQAVEMMAPELQSINDKGINGAIYFMTTNARYQGYALSTARDNFLKNNDDNVFNYIVPGDIKLNGKIIMTREQALQRGIFKPIKNIISTVGKDISADIKLAIDYYNSPQHKNQTVENLSKKEQKKETQDSKNDKIEYSPADYKGGWQSDTDYQSLSMGESIVAEKNIHDPVRPGILKRQVKGKMTCSKARSLKSKQKNKGNNTAKAAQRFCNYRGCKC